MPDLARWGTVLLLGAALTLVLLLFSRWNYPLFHTLAELAVIILGCAVFMVAWHARDYLDNSALLFIGIAALFAGLLDLAHILTYEGINLVPGASLNLSIQLRLSGRVLFAATLLIAPLAVEWKARPWLAVLLYAAASLLLSLAAALGFYPTLVDSSGQATELSIVLEYGVVLLLVAALILFLRRSYHFSPTVRGLLVAGITWAAASELALVLVTLSGGLLGAVAHIFKLVAYFLIYRAITQVGLIRPYEMMFYRLQTSRDELKRERDFVNDILNTTSAFVMVMDNHGRILRFNQAFENASGYSLKEIKGQPAWNFGIFSGGPGELEEFLKTYPINSQDRESLLHEGQLTTREQNRLHISWALALRQSEQNEVEYIIATGIDITDRKMAEDELRYLSTHDVMTDLYNRAYFEQEMVRLAETDNFPASIMVVDVDGLKAINDEYGHLAGDKLLQRVAHLLRTAFRQEDVVARMGGDEFAVLIASADEATAARAEQRVRAILAAYNQINPEYQIQMSIGTATAIAGYMLMETYKQADAAMYAEKVTHRQERPR